MRYILTPILLIALSASAQKVDWQLQVDQEQNRIDIVDGDLDGKVNIGNDKQNALATDIYFTRVDRIQTQIKSMEASKSILYARAMFEYLRKIEKHQIVHVFSQLRSM